MYRLKPSTTVCMPFTVLCNDGDIRLEGSVEEEGRVEVCINEVWGTVCDDSFTTVDANVVCGQLRYSRYSKLSMSSLIVKCKLTITLSQANIHF